jgi:hypothetical protein
VKLKVEEPIQVRVVIRSLKILLFLILQSPKPVTLLLEVETNWDEDQVVRRTCSLIQVSLPLGLHDACSCYQWIVYGACEMENLESEQSCNLNLYLS